VLVFGVVNAIAAIRVLCESDPSLGDAIVNGLLAWASVLGGFTTFATGLEAARVTSIPLRPEAQGAAINRGLGKGFKWGMRAGFLMFFVFAAKLVT
jgi:hypothetical protein